MKINKSDIGKLFKCEGFILFSKYKDNFTSEHLDIASKGEILFFLGTEKVKFLTFNPHIKYKFLKIDSQEIIYIDNKDTKIKLKLYGQ